MTTYLFDIGKGVLISIQIEQQNSVLTSIQKDSVANLIWEVWREKVSHQDIWLEEIPNRPPTEWPIFFTIGADCYELWPQNIRTPA